MVFEHSDELLDASGAGGGLFGALNSEQDREPISTIQRAKERTRLRAALQCSLEIDRRGGQTGRIICCLPASVSLGAVNLCQAGRLHAALTNQPLGFFSIDLRPDAAPATRCEFLEPARFIITLALTVDPPVTERNLDRFGIGYRASRRRFLGEPDP